MSNSKYMLQLSFSIVAVGFLVGCGSFRPVLDSSKYPGYASVFLDTNSCIETGRFSTEIAGVAKQSLIEIKEGIVIDAALMEKAMREHAQKSPRASDARCYSLAADYEMLRQRKSSTSNPASSSIPTTTTCRTEFGATTCRTY